MPISWLASGTDLNIRLMHTAVTLELCMQGTRFQRSEAHSSRVNDHHVSAKVRP